MNKTGLTPQRELEISRWAWKAFLGAHADECDTDAFVDLIVDETRRITERELGQELPDKGGER